jgi:hypothetical protein
MQVDVFNRLVGVVGHTPFIAETLKIRQ